MVFAFVASGRFRQVSEFLVEAKGKHLIEAGLEIEAVHHHAVDTDHHAGAVLTVQAMYEDGLIFRLQDDLQKTKHTFVPGSVEGVEGDALVTQAENLHQLFFFQNLTGLFPEIDHGFHAFAPQPGEAVPGGLAAPQQSLIDDLVIGQVGKHLGQLGKEGQGLFIFFVKIKRQVKMTP